MNASGYVKRKAAHISLKIISRIIAKIGIPIICFFLVFLILITGLSSQLQKTISVFSDSEISSSEIEDENGNKLKGKATYVGVDDRDTEFSRKVLAQTSRFSNSRNPYYNGYRNLCEGFCNAMYVKAGLPYAGSCCAYRHSVKTARKTGKIPKGALVFSGQKRDGSFYENNHAPGTFCTACNHWAGHIGIYVGNGIVVGSQIPYAMSLDTFIDVCGYGGWATY